MEKKRASKVRFRLGSEMEGSSTRKRSKTALLMDSSHSSNKCLPNFFVPALGEPFVKYKIPRFDFEKWDWMLFQWPHERVDANFEMTDIDFDALFEADTKRFEEFIDAKQRQVEGKEIEPPQQKPNSTEFCFQDLVEDSAFCFTDAST